MKTRPLIPPRKPVTGGCLALAICLLCGAAHSAFVPIDDFEALAPGPLDGQNGWRALSESTAVVPDPDGADNQVLQVITESTRLYHEALIPDGTARMLFLRFRYDDQLNVSFGMSEATDPDQFGDFDAELSLTSATNDLRINDGGSYAVLTTLTPATWYNAWLLVDNAKDVTAVWLHARPGDAALDSDRLDIAGEADFEFRDSEVNDLLTFYVKTGGGSGVLGPLYIDDIHLEDTDGVNLDNPAATTTGAHETPAPITSLAVQPNPFNPRTTITYSLAQSQYVEVLVHDLAGRTIDILVAGDQPSGKHALIWNGRDRTGRSVPSGVYMVRLRSASGTQVRKILLAR